VFTSILLADEINRASPRTQSALLEVMAEGQVSVEGRTHAMDDLFFVVATQNPVEFRGTYPLPEAQMDRFAMCIALGYVDADVEAEVLAAQDLGHPLASLRAIAAREEVLALKERVRHVRVARSCAATWWRSCGARASCRRSNWAAGRAPRSRSPAPPRRWRCSRARNTSGPSISSSSRCRCSRTAWCSILRRNSPAPPPRRWWPHPARVPVPA